MCFYGQGELVTYYVLTHPVTWSRSTCLHFQIDCKLLESKRQYGRLV